MNANMEKPYAVGIDIGGTNTVFGIVDANGSILASGSIKLISGRPFAVSHLDTALLLTPRTSASSVWVSPFFSRKVFIVIPVLV